MNSDDQKLIYVYCLTSFQPSQIETYENGKLYLIENNGLYLAVKNVSEDEYSEVALKKNISNESWLDTHVRAHISIISKIMETQTVIPFNFGTIYTSAETLNLFIDKYYSQLTQALHYLENKEEWSVKIYCDKNTVINNISILSSTVSDIELQIKNSSPGKAYILGKKKIELIGKEIAGIYNSYSKLFFTQLNSWSEEYRLNTILSNDLSGRDDDMILNVTFLIEKERLNNFIVLTDQMISQYENIGLALDLTGPWPPYTFLNLSH